MANPLESFTRMAGSIFDRVLPPPGGNEPKVIEAFLRGTDGQFHDLNEHGVVVDGCYSRVVGDERGPFYLDATGRKIVDRVGVTITRSREMDLYVDPRWAASHDEVNDFLKRVQAENPNQEPPEQDQPRQDDGGDLK